MITPEKNLKMVLGGRQMFTKRTASHTACQKRRCELHTGRHIYSHADHVFSNSAFNGTKVKKQWIYETYKKYLYNIWSSNSTADT